MRSPHTAAIIPETRTARQSRGRCAAAADFLGTQPIAVPPGFSPAAELLCGMKTQREYVAEAYLAGKAEAGNMISLPEWRDKAPPKASWDRK
jgi:hypothetical protein